MVQSDGLLHGNLNVSDLARSVRFYTEALGFSVVAVSVKKKELGAGAGPLRQVILTVPRTRTLLALTHAPSLPVGPGGLNHLGLILDADESVMEMTQRVTGLGGLVHKQGRREGAGVSEAFAYVHDPDGYAIELSTQPFYTRSSQTEAAEVDNGRPYRSASVFQRAEKDSGHCPGVAG